MRERPGPEIPVLLAPGASLPAYKSGGAAGADLRACIPEQVVLAPGERRLIPTGLRIQLPEGYEAQIRPRSGLALEKGITCLNAPGTVDSDYRGEIKVLLINLGSESASIMPDERIAQLVVASHCTGHFLPSDRLDDTDRGSGGFGSTGAC